MGCRSGWSAVRLRHESSDQANDVTLASQLISCLSFDQAPPSNKHLQLHTQYPKNYHQDVQAILRRGMLFPIGLQDASLTAPQHGAKNVVTLFHKPSSQASLRAHTLLKQADAQSVATATEDQASSHNAQNKAERTEFELDVTEAPPTADQLKNILEYLGGPSAVGRIIEGAKDETDALRRLKADGETFKRPLIVDWNQGKAGESTIRASSNSVQIANMCL